MEGSLEAAPGLLPLFYESSTQTWCSVQEHNPLSAVIPGKNVRGRGAGNKPGDSGLEIMIEEQSINILQHNLLCRIQGAWGRSRWKELSMCFPRRWHCVCCFVSWSSKY